MGNMNNAKAHYGLTASGIPAGTNIVGSITIGKEHTKEDLAGVDIAYSFKITSTTSSDVATIDLSAGTVAQTTGSPTITDGDGNDFEGATLPTLLDLSAILFECTEVSAGTISVASGDSNLPDFVASEDGVKCLAVYPTGKAVSPDTVVITFNDAASQSVTVTVTGKTTS